jgi:O-antigen ligase
MAAIKAEPFRPHGLLADRIVIAQEGTPTHMTYPHNLALEILYQWGLPLGIVLLAGILWLFVSGLWSLRHADENRLAVMLTFVPIALVQIMLSSSYLMSWLFAIAVGLLLAKKPNVTTAS